MKDELLQIQKTLDEIKKILEQNARLAGQPVFIPVYPQIQSGCQHEYPNPWMGIHPPACLKCGFQAQHYVVTCDNNHPYNPN